ncbi:MAG: Ig-like domain-containing protein [Solobacterium sp.]|nr:Ig-like domain-containing protein [Solobacterium sp.]
MKMISKLLMACFLCVLSVMPVQATAGIMAEIKSPSWSVKTLDDKTINEKTYASSLQLLIFYRGRLMEDGNAMCPNSSGTVRSFAECEWAGTKGLKIILIEADGSTKKETQEFLDKYGTNPNIIYAYDGESAMWSFASGSLTYAYCVLIQKGNVVKQWGANYNDDICASYISEYLSIPGYGFENLSFKGTDDYDDAQKITQLTNKIRAEAGKSPLTLDPKLTEAAMQRAAELEVVYAHMRPDNSDIFTVIPYTFYTAAENIAIGQESAEVVTDAWKNSSGHYANMIGDYTSIGVGSFYQGDGTRCWVQLFTDTNTGKCTETGKKEVTHKVHTFEKYLNLFTEEDDLTLNEGDSEVIKLYNGSYNFYSAVEVIPGYVYSSHPDRVSIAKDGSVRCLKAGGATVRIGISEKEYIEIKVGNGVEAVKLSLSETDLSLPATVEYALTVTAEPEGADLPELIWKSSDPGIAEVDAEGNVTALSEGTAIITVTSKDGSFKATCTVEVSGISMYRLYNPNSGEHFYTAKKKEKDALISYGWQYEGIGWVAPKLSKTPVYRLYNSYSGDHHYTMKEKERDALTELGWTYENVGWYSDDEQNVPLYREYNPNMSQCNHNYTTNKKEHDWLCANGWNDEKIGWYGIMEGKK